MCLWPWGDHVRHQAEGDKQYIVFRRTKAKRTYTAPKKWKAKEVCTVQDSCKKLKKNGRVKVGLSPLLLK